jgi:Holliday junction resolvase RusA-like endonuclease
MTVKFNVLGEPQGKGRPRFANVKGKTITRTPDKTVLYENLVISEYRRQVGDVRFPDGEAVRLHIEAMFAIPASASKKKKTLMEAGEILPTKKPDIDNVLKVVADSLNGVAYRDDAQVVGCTVEKFYSTQPRIEVTILSANERKEQGYE